MASKKEKQPALSLMENKIHHTETNQSIEEYNDSLNSTPRRPTRLVDEQNIAPVAQDQITAPITKEVVKDEVSTKPPEIIKDKFHSEEVADKPHFHTRASSKTTEGASKVLCSRRDDDDSEFDDGQSEFEEDEKNLDKDWVEQSIDILSTNNFEQKVKANLRFKSYSQVFNNLLVPKAVPTKFPVVSINISQDSLSAIVVTKHDENKSCVTIYSLLTQHIEFKDVIGGKPTQYIKMKDVAQNETGDKYALVYFDDGKFRLRTFERKMRTDQEVEEDVKKEITINDLLGIGPETLPIHEFQDPFITCCFISDKEKPEKPDQLFIQLVHVQLVPKEVFTHYHFLWNIEERKIEGTYHKQKMEDSSRKNFPFKCFFNKDDQEIYCFYRQGEFFNMKVNDIHTVETGDCTDMSLGEMYLVFNKALVAQSSQEIVFFRLEQIEGEDDNDSDTMQFGQREWVQYHTLHHQGTLFFTQGNIRIQVTTEDHIFFYLIDPKTLMPSLENVMNNYMGCTSMMYSRQVKYCVTYNSNQSNFDVFTRKYSHNFKVPVQTTNFENGIGLELKSVNGFLVSQRDRISMFDSQTYQKIGEVPIELFKSETREITQILAMQKCENEEYLGVISGLKLIREESQLNQLFIFKKVKGEREGEGESFKQIHRVVLREEGLGEYFKQVCLIFYFLKEKDQTEKRKIIFSRIDQIFTLNFHTKKVEVLYKFGTAELSIQPQMMVCNDDQSIFLLASREDCIYVDVPNRREVDMDDKHGLAFFSSIFFDTHGDNQMYIIANKLDHEMGFFILKLPANDPLPNKKGNQYIVKWKRRLDIADCQINVIRDLEKGYHEIVVSYKTIFINVYNILVLDLQHKSKQPLMYRHESFQLWEGMSGGLLLSTHDFVIINKDGLNVLSLGSKHKKELTDADNDKRIMHSLPSQNYLKLDPTNILVFYNQNYEKREIQIQQVYQHESKENETVFKDIYKIKIWAVTLRELLLFQSLYVCKSQQQIQEIVNNQPNPLVFYKTFLELNGTNMASIMSFDSKAMASLLDERHESLFSSEYPIFYKNKVDKGKAENEKYCYRNALDVALQYDQSRSIEKMIDYLVRYQNHFFSHYLFLKNFNKIMEKGIKVTQLLRSNILCIEFDYDEWPVAHTNKTKYLRPYNGSIFNIRTEYRKVFKEKKFADILAEDNPQKPIDSSTIYKICYKLLLIPSFGEHIKVPTIAQEPQPAGQEDNGEEDNGEEAGGNKCKNCYSTAVVTDEKKNKKSYQNEGIHLMDTISKSDELTIFQTDVIQDFIEFKWQAIGRTHHNFGFFYHLSFVVYLFIYVIAVYIHASFQDDFCKDPTAKGITYNQLSIPFAFFAIYPIYYEGFQLSQVGREYFFDTGNLNNICFNLVSLANAYLHITRSPYKMMQQFTLVVLLLFSMMRILELIRIYKEFSPIYTMMTRVIIDFQEFALFFFILLVFLSLGLSIMQLGNPTAWNDYERAIKDSKKKKEDYTGSGYHDLNGSIKNLLIMLRTSTADFQAVETSQYINNPADNYVFWGFYVVCILITLIFINFVVAKAVASYETIEEFLEEYIWKDRSTLVAEADEMRPRIAKDEKTYPQYIVVREVKN